MADTNEFYYKIRLFGEDGHSVMCLEPREYIALNDCLLNSSTLRKGLELAAKSENLLSNTIKEEISDALERYGDSIIYQFVGKYKKQA